MVATNEKLARTIHPAFVLTAANGEPIGRSEMYSSGSVMESGIASVKANAPGAPTKHLTA